MELSFRDITYKFIEKLGEGTYSKVYHIETEDKNKYALKIYKDNQEFLEQFIMLKIFNSNYIMKALDVHFHKSVLCLKMKVCDKNKFSFINNDYTILLALQELHHAGFFHCDIKGDNFLLDNDKIILTDFSLTTPIRSYISMREIYTLPYRPPECFFGYIDKSSDLWAYAIHCLYSGTRYGDLQNLTIKLIDDLMFYKAFRYIEHGTFNGIFPYYIKNYPDSIKQYILFMMDKVKMNIDIEHCISVIVVYNKFIADVAYIYQHDSHLIEKYQNDWIPKVLKLNFTERISIDDVLKYYIPESSGHDLPPINSYIKLPNWNILVNNNNPVPLNINVLEEINTSNKSNNNIPKLHNYIVFMSYLCFNSMYVRDMNVIINCLDVFLRFAVHVNYDIGYDICIAVVYLVLNIHKKDISSKILNNINLIYMNHDIYDLAVYITKTLNYDIYLDSSKILSKNSYNILVNSIFNRNPPNYDYIGNYYKLITDKYDNFTLPFRIEPNKEILTFNFPKNDDKDYTIQISQVIRFYDKKLFYNPQNQHLTLNIIFLFHYLLSQLKTIKIIELKYLIPICAYLLDLFKSKYRILNYGRNTIDEIKSLGYGIGNIDTNTLISLFFKVLDVWSLFDFANPYIKYKELSQSTNLTCFIHIISSSSIYNYDLEIDDIIELSLKFYFDIYEKEYFLSSHLENTYREIRKEKLYIH